MEEPPIWVSGTMALEGEAACLAFGAIATVESVLGMKETRRTKKLQAFLTLRGSNEEEESDDDS